MGHFVAAKYTVRTTSSMQHLTRPLMCLIYTRVASIKTFASAQSEDVISVK